MKHQAPSSFHREKLADEDPLQLQFGSKVPSKNVLKTIKSESNTKRNIIQKIIELKENLEKEDHQVQIGNINLGSKIQGDIHYLCVLPDFQVYTFNEASLRWYDAICNRGDYLYIDATGNLFNQIGHHKQSLYYSLVGRSPFQNVKLPTLPLAEMVTTNHTAFQIKHFLESEVFNGRKLFGSRLSNPKIVLLDFSLAIISASVQA